MPTPIDRAVQQRGPFFAFAAVVAGVAAWSIWGQDIFPSQDPTGDPETWTHDQCITWLKHPWLLSTYHGISLMIGAVG
ncbi:uncharacterized protein ALTATR162_LOCUS10550 [Alternaria atra]|uniref:Uncharacterized protein n=1 Tax=Alternaria atra TaxID=119953 RepID=A0A8J2IMG4_9PLEO|nr:uncharacterized protein ALTATR162_LOCUS10550 [Alternaria atra]CAG5183375.1 unnamed protein product [Alternaria atra]